MNGAGEETGDRGAGILVAGMEGCYVPNNPAHYGLDGGWGLGLGMGMGIGMGMGAGDDLSLPALDLDPLPSLFPFSPCSGAATTATNPSTAATINTTPYKSDFGPVIWKNGEEAGAGPAVKQPHDMADVLLSLKHAVVHPPGQTSSSPLGYPYSPQLYSVHPHQPHQMMSISPGAPSYPNFSTGNEDNNGTPYGLDAGELCADNNGNPHQPAPVFSSMSVNVSMNMMHGYPPNINDHQIPSPQTQWFTVAANSGSGASPNYQTPSQGLLSPQHPGSNYLSNGATYSFADFRQIPGTMDQSFLYTNPLAENCGSGGGGTTPTYRPVTPMSPMSPSNLNSSTPNHLKNIGNYNLSLSPHMSPVLGTTSPGGKSKRSVDGVKVNPVLATLQHECTNNENSTDRPNLCRICGKTYARPSTLKTHLRTHSGEKPYRCEDCNKSFSQAANLTAHVRTHSGEKPFKCNICDRRFSQSSSVTTHMRTHSGERPYRCRLCRKAFSDSSTLTKHLRIHSGEKPYQCKLCLLRFSQSGNLNRHMRVHGQHYVIGI